MAKTYQYVQFLYTLTFLIFFRTSQQHTELNKTVIVILSQSDQYHENKALQLQQDVLSQAEELQEGAPTVLLSHSDFSHKGSWTILPIIQDLVDRYGDHRWFIFCKERTKFRLPILKDIFSKYNNSEEIWFGHALYDREPTIIHHFMHSENSPRFHYPNIGSGVAISGALAASIAESWNAETASDAEFSIDAYHELALFIWRKGEGSALKHEDKFCVSDKGDCATYIVPFIPCDRPLSKESVYFAVKTCEKYHKNRVKVVKETWGKHALHIQFFSNAEDESIPTIYRNIPNTESGHCGKTMAIIKYIAKEIENNSHIKWVVIADDDSILSVIRLMEALSCYDSENLVMLGERYAYNINLKQGYSYITGGGGIVLSASLVQLLSSPGVCECPLDSSPDDMYLGICAKRLGINVIHSSSFHQARPPDYAPEYLHSSTPVSFHKHWMIDPYTVYKKWFADADQNDEYKHIEL